MGKWRRGSAVGGLCMLIMAGWSFAQRNTASTSPEKLLPEQSIVYAHVDGSVAHQESWEKTAAYEALYESGLMAVFTNALEEFGGQAPPQALALQESLQVIEQQGFSLAVAVDPPNQGPPQPWGVIVLHNAAKLRNGLNQLAAQAPPKFDLEEVDYRDRKVTHGMIPDSPAQIGWWAEQGHLVIAVGINAIDAAMDVADGTRKDITAGSNWGKYSASSADFEVTQAGWLDFAPLREMFGGMPVPVPSATPEKPVRVIDLLTTLGLDNLNCLAVRSGYKGRSLWTEQFVDAPGEKRGLLALTRQEMIQLSDLPPMPATQNGFVASSFDWGLAYDAILGVVREGAKYGPPGAADQIDPALAEVERELGINLEEDLFDVLGNIHCLYTDSMHGSFGLGSAIAISVKDEAALRQTLGTALGRIEGEARGEVVIGDVQKGTRDFLTINIPKFPVFVPTISVNEGWLVIGLNTQAVEAFYLRKDGRLPKWEPNAAYQAALAEVPQKFSAISAMDPSDTYRMLLGVAPTLVGLAELGIRESREFAPGFQMPIDAADFPPAELVTMPLFPNVTVTEVTDDGVRTVSRTSLPGFPLAGGNVSGASGVATTAVLVALLLPAVQQARQAARRAQSKNNLKQMGLAMHNYHDTFNHFPQGAVPNAELDSEEQLSWMVSILPYMDQAALYNEINQKQGWNDDDNLPVSDTVIPSYVNPGSPMVSSDDYAESGYVGIGGVGAKAPYQLKIDKKSGVFSFVRPTRIRDITDGTSNTAMVAEASRSASPWTAASESIRPLTQQPYINGPDGIGGPYNGGCNMLFGDGSVRFLSEDVDPGVMEALSTIAGGEVVGDF